jgi:type II secretory pathway component GspD/PulD (secretin)
MIQFQPAPFLTEYPSGADDTNTIVQWEIILAQFKVDDTERHGLSGVFKIAGQKNAVITDEIERSELVGIARANSNVVLNLASGAYAARCTFAESTNLFDYLTKSHGVDVLSQPKVTTRGTNSALMQVANNITIVIDDPNKPDPSAILTTNITVGSSASLRLLGRTNDRIAIEASARLDEFHGYDDTHRKKNARPNLAVSTMGTRAELNTNEVILLGGPIQMHVLKTVDRVPYLSEIPLVGRIFTKQHVHTNFVRTLVIVRPRVQ